MAKPAASVGNSSHMGRIVGTPEALAAAKSVYQSGRYV
jgi:hypothetical protein